ncbi:hypothetical protein V2I01_08825 [Micromonospora sp. BRA006-A]|nr:hypothetical protein [Micromonospora sp. BRA006-A]
MGRFTAAGTGAGMGGAGCGTGDGSRGGAGRRGWVRGRWRGHRGAGVVRHRLPAGVGLLRRAGRRQRRLRARRWGQ